MSQYPSCTTCGMPAGNCRHTTEGQVTPRPLSRGMAALLGQSPTRRQTAELSPQLPASPAAAGGADLERACRALLDAALLADWDQPDTATARQLEAVRLGRAAISRARNDWTEGQS